MMTHMSGRPGVKKSGTAEHTECVFVSFLPERCERGDFSYLPFRRHERIKGGSVMQMTGAKIVIETLIEQGCDTLFGYPGG